MPYDTYEEDERSKLISRIKWNFKTEGQPSACPYCGESSFYRKVTFSGKSQFNYNFDGTIADNSELHDGVKYSEQKSVFCLGCDKKLGIEIS